MRKNPPANNPPPSENHKISPPGKKPSLSPEKKHSSKKHKSRDDPLVAVKRKPTPEKNESILAPATKPSLSPEKKQASKKHKARADESDPHAMKKELAPIRKNLPVYKHKSELIKLVTDHEALLVVAETGSGKSTQIPAYLHESGLLKRNTRFGTTIAVTQPRRVAAMTVAKRVAQEVGCRPGATVGHRVRFDDLTHPQVTRIIYQTDGMLLREATTDPLMSKYGVVILDEAHERSLQTDVLFGVVKRAMDARRPDVLAMSIKKKNDEDESSRDAVMQRRMRQRAQKLKIPPLRVVVMSATLEMETFQSFFPKASKIQIPGRQFPVQILYTKDPQEDYMDSALLTALQIHNETEDGDILIFLPGQEEIEDLATLLRQHIQKGDASMESNGKDLVQAIQGIGTNLQSNSSSMVRDVLVCVLYAALPPAAQMLAFQPKPQGCRRKIILSTNIAETSVTLNGIRYVVDCGKHKTREFSSATGMESLTVNNISKAQAAQRSGRAGRVEAGLCFRLYTEDAFNTLEENIVPEILRVNLAQVVLQLKGMGVHDPRSFDFLTPPSSESIEKAFELLQALEAVDADLKLTEYGKKLAKLPLDPSFGHLLLQSSKYGCTSDMLTAVSMMSAENVFYRQNENSGKAAAAHRRFASYEGDIPTLLNVYQAWRKEAVYSNNGKKNKKQEGKLAHGDWCTRNFISGRALTRAHDVRHQLKDICSRSTERNGLGMDMDQSSGAERETFFKAVCAGLFLQVATRVQSTVEVKGRGNSGAIKSSRGRYKTKIGGREVSIHPTSTMFGRNPAPKSVVYTELLTTKKTYIRGVTQVREEWLPEVAPQYFKSGGK